MSDPTQTQTGTSREIFGAIVSRLANGLEARVAGASEISGPVDTFVDGDRFADDFPGGALLARTAWHADGEERSGCFLCTGSVGELLGGSETAPERLSDTEVETICQSLRLLVEEGGEDDAPLEWADLERVSSANATDALRECGLSGISPAARFALRVGTIELVFVFVGSAVDFVDPPAPEEALAPAGIEEAPAAAAGPTEVAADSVPTEPAGAPDPSQLQNVLDVPLSLTIRLGSTHLSLDEVLHLIPGSVVELDQREEEPLEVLANGRVIARGEVVVVDERFGLRVTEIVKSEDRLAATS